jgi:hypothetical protein
MLKHQSNNEQEPPPGGATLDFLLSLKANKEMFEQNLNLSFFFIKLINLSCHIRFAYIFCIYKYTNLYIFINRNTQFYK